MSVRAGVLAWVVGFTACAGRAPAPDAPVIIAGSVCSGVRGLTPRSLGEATAEPAHAPPELLAVLSEGESPDSPQELALVELGTQRLRWRRSVRAGARPQILESLVVTASTDRQLVAYDLANGQERFRRELDRPFWLGAAQRGRTLLITTGASSWDPRQRGSTLTALDAVSGARRWSREVPAALTRPVIRGNRALVVADRADLWALDLETGTDVGCGSIGGNTVEWIEREGRDVFFGASEARVLGDDARARPAPLELPRADLPGRPFLRESSYLPQPAGRSAHGRVGVFAPLHTNSAGPVLTRDGFYFIFYRDVFGFRPDGNLAWAQLLDTDVVRARASAAGLWLVTQAGELALLSAETGIARVRSALGRSVVSADLVVGSAPVAAYPQLTAAPDLQASLKQLAKDSDARLLPARLLAVDELARVETSSASADLLEIYAAPNTPPGLQDRIERRLRERKRGGEVLVAALDAHEDFLDERKAPPLRAIVPGLVTQNETRAVPGLVEHLFDPNTSLADLGLLVSAIDALSGERGREPLLRFFQMYRADSALSAEPGALALAADALIARGDANDRATLEAARDNPLTAAALRDQLSTLLEPPATAATEAAPVPVPVPVAPEPEPPPVELRTLLDEARSSFEPCLGAAQARVPKLTSVRLRFVARPDGAARELHVMPYDRELAACLGAKLAELELPSERKRLVSYRLVLQPTAATQAAATQAPANDAFWARAEQRASKPTQSTKHPPWWLDQNPLFVAIDTAPPPTPLLPAKAAAPAAAARPTPAEAPSAATPSSTTRTAPSPTPSEDTWWVPVQPSKP